MERNSGKYAENEDTNSYNCKVIVTEYIPVIFEHNSKFAWADSVNLEQIAQMEQSDWCRHCADSFAKHEGGWIGMEILYQRNKFAVQVI